MNLPFLQVEDFEMEGYSASGAVYHITGGENARAGGMTGFIGYQKSPVVGSQSFGSIDDPVLRSLADGNDHAVGWIEMMRIRYIGEGAIFMFDDILEDHAVVSDLHRSFVILKLDTFQLGIAEFVLAGCHFLCDGEAGQFLDAFTDGSAGYIHGGISGADDDHPFAKTRIFDTIT